MAAVDITISGVLYDKQNKTSQQVALIGEASLTGLGVGGGPVIPPGQPPGIWGPTDPRPGWGLPGQPPGIWGPTDPRPGWGLPPEGEKPPEPTEPPVQWKAVWHPVEGWVVVGIINPQGPHPAPSK